MWSVRQLRDATITELLGEAFSMRSILRLHERSIVRCELVWQLEASIT